MFCVIADPNQYDSGQICPKNGVNKNLHPPNPPCTRPVSPSDTTPRSPPHHPSHLHLHVVHYTTFRHVFWYCLLLVRELHTHFTLSSLSHQHTITTLFYDSFQKVDLLLCLPLITTRRSLSLPRRSISDPLELAKPDCMFRSPNQSRLWPFNYYRLH